MTINIMEEYLSRFVRDKITKYMKLIFEYKYDRNVCKNFIESYIKIRYNNFDNLGNKLENGDSLRKRILDTLNNTQNNLIIDYPEEEEFIKNTHTFFYYVLYFDGVVHYKNIDEKIEKICKLREKLLKKNNENFKENLKNSLEEFQTEEMQFLERFKSKEFELKISNYNINNVYRVKLTADIKFPELYSQTSIIKGFNTGLVKEEKLYIEYYLISLKIINDLKKLNMKRHYIVEFADTLLKKEKKIKGILNIINDPAIQDKLSLKIRYNAYIENKEMVEKLIKSGYHIAIILDSSFETTYYNAEKLNIFSYVIINESLDNYDEIMNFKNTIKNIIIV